MIRRGGMASSAGSLRERGGVAGVHCNNELSEYCTTDKWRTEANGGHAGGGG